MWLVTRFCGPDHDYFSSNNLIKSIPHRNTRILVLYNSNTVIWKSRLSITYLLHTINIIGILGRILERYFQYLILKMLLSLERKSHLSFSPPPASRNHLCDSFLSGLVHCEHFIQSIYMSLIHVGASLFCFIRHHLCCIAFFSQLKLFHYR